MPFKTEPLDLTLDQRQELEDRSASRSLPAGEVLRARMILMLAEGQTSAEIKDRLQTTAPTSSRWRKRFLAEGVNGLW